MLGVFLFGSLIEQLPNLFYILLSPFLWLGRFLFGILFLKQVLFNKNIINASVLILALFALLATGTLLPWYLSWWMPFLALTTNLRSLLFWSSIGLGAYFFLYSTSIALFIIGGLYLAAGLALKEIKGP
jgi:hypothetical protein